MSKTLSLDVLAKIPKVELHVHLEGTIAPVQLYSLAKKNNLPNPSFLVGPNETIAWKDFTDFLTKYDEVSLYLRSQQDLQQLTFLYLEQCHREGSVYNELTVSPLHAKEIGLTYEQAMESVAAGIDQARQAYGIEARIIIILVRHTGVVECAKVLEQVIQNPHPYIVGIGLAGDERAFPARDFKDLYKQAKNAGLQCTAHAGEWGGAEQVREAIDILEVTRIGHGVQVIDDPALLDYVIEKQIHLEVCPMSNIALQVYPHYDSHPIHQFQKLGVNYSLNSDDPPFFATTLGFEYQKAAQELNLNKHDLFKISQNALEASFAPEDLKQVIREKMQHQFERI